jgi:hypothetical protein
MKFLKMFLVYCIPIIGLIKLVYDANTDKIVNIAKEFIEKQKNHIFYALFAYIIFLIIQSISLNILISLL